MRRLFVASSAVLMFVALGLSPADALTSPVGPGLVRAASSAKAVIWDGEYFDGDLGIYVAAGNDSAFRFRVRRLSYNRELVAKHILTEKTAEILPEDMVTDFGGLNDFLRIRVKDSTGKTKLNTFVDFCPNGWDPQRIDTGAPLTSPFPWGCQTNPYALGAVWAVERGYAMPSGVESALVSGDDDGPAPLAAGTYNVDVRIARPWREFLHIPDSRAVVEVTLHVTTETSDDDESDFEERSVKAQAAPPRTSSSTRPSASATLPADAPLPDLRTLPAWEIEADGDHVSFSATVWNAGPAPLVVDGFRRSGEDLMDAYQYSLDAQGRERGHQLVGSMEWDPKPDHEHWHFRDFARYSLVDADKKEVFRSRKEAFCLANTDMVDYTVRGANWRPGGTDLHTACGSYGSLSVREVLDTGSGDTYFQGIPGQSLSLKNLPNGRYFIKVEANPVHRLRETSYANNVSYRRIDVGGVPGHRTVKAATVGVIDESSWCECDDPF